MSRSYNLLNLLLSASAILSATNKTFSSTMFISVFADQARGAGCSKIAQLYPIFRVVLVFKDLTVTAFHHVSSPSESYEFAEFLPVSSASIDEKQLQYAFGRLHS